MNKNTESLDLLCRREIEIKILAPVISAFSAEIGKERAFEIAGKAIQEVARKQGALISGMTGKGLDNLKKSILKPNEENTLELTVIEDTDNIFRFDVTRCSFAELYGQLGYGNIGTLVSCDRDASFLEGFDDSLELVRERTIMSGDTVCDFCYRKKR